MRENGPGGETRAGAIGFAFLAITSSSALTLLLRGTMAIWPVGLAGTLSRLLSVALLALWVGTRGRRWRRLDVADVGGWLLLMGVVSTVINLSWFAGMRWTTATNATLLFRADLLFVLLIGAVLGLERISAVAWAVVPLMLLGLGLLMDVRALDWAGHTRGDALILLSALGLAVNAFVIRHILRRMDGEAVALYNYAFSGVGFALLMLVEDPQNPGVALAQSTRWLWIAAVGVVAAVSLPWYYAALGRLAVWKLKVLMLLSPPLVALTEWLIWGAVLGPGQWVGAALIVVGAGVLVQTERMPVVAPGPATPRDRRRTPPGAGTSAARGRLPDQPSRGSPPARR